jgi:gluconolactonase
MTEAGSYFRLVEQMRCLAALALIGSLTACDGGTGEPTGPGTGGGGGTGGDSTGTGGTAGQGGTTTSTGPGGSGGSGGSPQAICPPGSETLQLDLAGATPVAVAGVPPADGYSPGFSILEGPVWIEGALFLSQISSSGQPPAARILRVATGSAAEIFLDDAGTNGLAVDGGQLFGAVHEDGSISRFDLASPGSAPVVVAAEYLGARFNSPNDLAIRSDGNIYFTDPDWQAPDPAPQAAERAYRISPGGAVEPCGEYMESGSLEIVQKPNGVTLTRDENTLYIGGTSGLFKFPVAAGGAVGIGSPVAAVSGGVDGLAKDCAGNLYVTNGQSVVVLDEDDALIGSIPVGIQVTNVAFGGADGRTLYITSLGAEPKLHEVVLNVPGYPY